MRQLTITTHPLRLLAMILPMMLAAMQATAGFVGFTGEVHAVSEHGTTYRIYASFDDAGDELIAIYSIGSTEANPVALSTTVTTSFYQNPFGGSLATSINPAFFGAFPDLVYDSWLTIGSESSQDPEVSSIGISVPMGDFEAGQSFTFDGGSWYVAPGTNSLATAGEDLKVLVAQFTVVDGGTVTLDWNMQYDAASGETMNVTGATFDTSTIIPPVTGCTDDTACNFDAEANTEDGSCIIPDASACEYCDGSTIAVADADGDGTCDDDEVFGCTVSIACNYNEAATEEDGSCVFALPGTCEVCEEGAVVLADADGDSVCDADEVVGCQDENACNYDASATDAGACTYADGNCEVCDGNGGVAVQDADGDGICNDDEIAGCDDEDACNFSAAATDNDGSCLYAMTACEICDGNGGVLSFDDDGDGVCNDDEVLGCDDLTACNFQPGATEDDGSCYYAPEGVACEDYCHLGDWDGDGVCDADEVEGCTSTSATNFEPEATDDDGSCVWADGFFLGLSVEQIAVDSIPGAKTFRVYADFSSDDVEIAAVFGTDEDIWSIFSTEPFYQNAAGGLIGTTINPMFFAALPELEYDTWLALGGEPGDSDDALTVGMEAFFNDFEDFGSNVLVDTEVGASVFYTPGGSVHAFPVEGKLLLGQFTTSGVVSLKYNIQFRDPDQSTIQIPDLNITFPAYGLGCTDSEACNYNPAATVEDDSCTYPTGACEACDGEGGIAVLDADGDGVCDADEIAGCQDETACNYDATATDSDDSCVYADGNCEICNEAGGITVLDMDGDGVCDADEIAGCQDATACNYNPAATDSDDSCVYADGNCEVCDNGGVAVLDADGDGICDADEIPGCQDETACNYDATATDSDGSCVFADNPCDICDGEGGVTILDTDGDGVCDADEVAGCTDSEAFNFDENATDEDGSCYYGGCTILAACNYEEDPEVANDDICEFPDPFTNCDGTACGGDYDGDGVLEGDEVHGCMSESATNFDPTATEDDGSCIWENDFLGLEYEVVAEDGVPGMTTYHVYALFDPSASIDAISSFGDAADPWVIATTTSFFQAELGVDFGGNLNPGLYSFFPILQYDTWMTVGALPGDFNALAQTGMFDYLDAWNNGGDFVVDVDPGASIFLPEGASDQGYPDEDGRLLLAQLTTDGIVSLQYNLTYQDADNNQYVVTDVEMSFPEVDGGCTDPEAYNYDPTANFEDCSCLYLGCTNPEADNYDAQANDDDGSCLFTGCADESADNYWSLANTGDQEALCEYWGCMDPTADNYDPGANVDPEDECLYYGCMNPEADNYDEGANIDPNDVCLFTGCADPEADNYWSLANTGDQEALCEYEGCTNDLATNYDPQANVDDGTCIFIGCFDLDAWNYWPLANAGDQDVECDYEGCMDPEAVNYDPDANVQVVTTCDYLGCTIENADNYDPQATINDGTCIVEGCMYEAALNYDPNATYDAELSCEFETCPEPEPCAVLGCMDEAADNYDADADTDDGSCMYIGCTDAEALNFDPGANYDYGCEYTPTSNCLGDLNFDLSVDVQDLLIFFQQYGTLCSE